MPEATGPDNAPVGPGASDVPVSAVAETEERAATITLPAGAPVVIPSNIFVLPQLPQRPIATIAFASKNNTKMCVGLTGFTGNQPANIYCTSDFTQPQPSWTNVSVPVDVSVVSLAIDPVNNSIMYAGTDFAIWYTNDGGSSWAFMGPAMGMPNTAVYDIIARAGRVIAFTHGRGAFMLVNFDLNNDGIVDCADMSILRGAFGKRVGEQGYIANADLNGDNIVNLRDLSMLTQMLSARTYCQ